MSEIGARREVQDLQPLAETDEQVPPHATHHQFLDELIAQVRAGHVSVTVADGKSPIIFRPLAHGGESMVLSGIRLPINGTPYDLPFLLKVGLHSSSPAALEERRRREASLRRHMNEEHWFPHQHARLHRCPDGEDRMVTMQQPLKLEGSMRLWAGYAELRTRWDATEGTTVDSKSMAGGRLPRLEPDDPFVRRYTRVNQKLVLDCAGENEPDVGRMEFLTAQGSKPLAQLVNQARRDPDMRELLSTFVERAILYSEATGEILDLLGDGDNVVFHPAAAEGKGSWNVALLDPLHPSVRVLNRLPEAMISLSSPELPQNWRQQVNNALNGLNYVRTVNGLAKMLNMRQRLAGWRRCLSDETREAIDFPLILERCRACSVEERSDGTSADTPDDGTMTCPRDQIEILMRKG